MLIAELIYKIKQQYLAEYNNDPNSNIEDILNNALYSLSREISVSHDNPIDISLYKGGTISFMFRRSVCLIIGGTYIIDDKSVIVVENNERRVVPDVLKIERVSQ